MERSDSRPTRHGQPPHTLSPRGSTRRAAGTQHTQIAVSCIERDTRLAPAPHDAPDILPLPCAHIEPTPHATTCEWSVRSANGINPKWENRAHGPDPSASCVSSWVKTNDDHHMGWPAFSRKQSGRECKPGCTAAEAAVARRGLYRHQDGCHRYSHRERLARDRRAMGSRHFETQRLRDQKRLQNLRGRLGGSSSVDGAGGATRKSRVGGGGDAKRRGSCTAGAGTSKEVATTVTAISSPYSSSTEVPKMMLASSATMLPMTDATSFTSCSDMSELPVIVKTTPLARSIGKSSRGDETAARAASRARVLPKPRPMPMSAGPASVMTERTSAKSTLIRPGLTTMSEMPVIPCRRISSAIEKASCSGTPSGTISSSLSFDTTIRMSTCDWSSSIASAA
mmetsp:Transcript_71383/g.195663  ORF Transcript_71383/g.195663 Transcript_71383/m.195663 type:complete len:396 (+) Transcript_71383:42-1229(+)